MDDEAGAVARAGEQRRMQYPYWRNIIATVLTVIYTAATCVLSFNYNRSWAFHLKCRMGLIGLMALIIAMFQTRKSGIDRKLCIPLAANVLCQLPVVTVSPPFGFPIAMHLLAVACRVAIVVIVYSVSGQDNYASD